LPKIKHFSPAGLEPGWAERGQVNHANSAKDIERTHEGSNRLTCAHLH